MRSIDWSTAVVRAGMHGKDTSSLPSLQVSSRFSLLFLRAGLRLGWTVCV
jgi:hypothetical protein